MPAIIDVKKKFGATVRGWRNHLGISQEKLAERADLHRTYISDVERGARNVSLESIERLARALEISVSALFPLPEADDLKKHLPGNGHGRHLISILLVEDNPDDVVMTLRAFKKARFANHVHVVNDGAEALDYVFCKGKYAGHRMEEHLQLILLDLKLPQVGGLEVLRRLKADPRTRPIPIVILTISQETCELDECLRLGAENCIVKPVDFQRLSRATPQLNLDWALVKPPESESRSVAP
jgi:CheY-like chemotaxis protein/DNA-binding XRE family transcriptional regulator